MTEFYYGRRLDAAATPILCSTTLGLNTRLIMTSAYSKSTSCLKTYQEVPFLVLQLIFFSPRVKLGVKNIIFLGNQKSCYDENIVIMGGKDPAELLKIFTFLR